jgi:hypothetical protein
MPERKLLFSRTLPGGGVVTIEAEPQEAACRAVLTVERRTDSTRRDGHVAPVIAEAVGPTEAAAFEQLYPIATNNVRVAQHLRSWQQEHRRG